jgi:hypothetical protein
MTNLIRIGDTGNTIADGFISPDAGFPILTNGIANKQTVYVEGLPIAVEGDLYSAHINPAPDPDIIHEITGNQAIGNTFCRVFAYGVPIHITGDPMACSILHIAEGPGAVRTFTS